MIAPQRVPQYEIPRSRERAKHATRRRSTRAKAQAYVGLGRIALAIVVVVFPLMVYVMLTANLTGMHYAVARAETQRTTLTDEAQRLDDTIARLESRERLATVAAKLHMHDPHEYAVVALPESAAKPKPKGIAFLGNMGDWFSRP
jgi:hypothetical protein